MKFVQDKQAQSAENKIQGYKLKELCQNYTQPTERY